MAEAILDVVNENDEIVGSAPRSQIHKEGLLHREIHVWFVTPDRKVIFQKRAPKPPLRMIIGLDATIGGHVELGQSYYDAALMEVAEEAGIDTTVHPISLYKKYRVSEVFPQYDITNNVFREVYLCHFSGDLADLKIEEGKGAGFLAVPAEKLSVNPLAWAPDYWVIPYLYSPDMMALYEDIANNRM